MNQQDSSEPRRCKTWSKAELDMLQEIWGKYSIPTIAKRLGRSVNAIKVKAARLGLGPILMAGEWVTLNQLVIAVRGNNGGYNYLQKSWVQNRGLPVHMKRVVNNSFQVVYLDEFWEWAERNRSFIDFSKFEPLSLGAEPDWVKEQRKYDFKSFAIQRKDPWTKADDANLKRLVEMHKYGYAELSSILQRSAGAIQRRLTDLDIKDRPVKADNHGETAAWTELQFEILADGIRKGKSYTQIGNELGKSEKAIRGKVYFVYLTENADKVRAYMGEGPWGAGAPEPTVKQAATLSRTRTETRALLEQLCGVLQHRTLELKKSDYDNYFQREVCVHWDVMGSTCKMGCSDCDSCVDFQRIKPQYCVRCGATFFERMPNKRCFKCRQDRKRMAARKYRYLYGASNKED